MKYRLSDQSFTLIANKALFWENTRSLLISDPHFGKSTHFRKHGIFVPEHIIGNDLRTLENLIIQYEPDRLLILGDLFHSRFNKECDLFYELIKKFPLVQIWLIKGNHDILKPEVYVQMGIKVVWEYAENEILLTHEPFILDRLTESTFKYHISGHIHPAFKISGKAHQGITLPCFIFGQKQALLPAFGSFTGNKTIRAQSGDRIFVISDETIIPLNL